MTPEKPAERWRVCRSNPLAIHLQRGAEPAADDPVVGLMNTPERATQAINAVNGEAG